MPKLSLPVITQKSPLSSPSSHCQLTGSTDGWVFPCHIFECHVLPWQWFTSGTSLGIPGMSHHFPLVVQAAAFFSSDVSWKILTHICTRWQVQSCLFVPHFHCITTLHQVSVIVVWGCWNSKLLCYQGIRERELELLNIPKTTQGNCARLPT